VEVLNLKIYGKCFRYEEPEVGDVVKIYGDSSQYGDRIHIHATKITE
jgi:hypothetical protein